MPLAAVSGALSRRLRSREARSMSTSKKGVGINRSHRTARTSQRKARNQLMDFFRPFGIPPTPIHEAVQNAALAAGWIPPWVSSAAKAKTQSAGKKSGQMRKGRADLRRKFVKAAYDSMKLASRLQPYADTSLDELEEKYLFAVTGTNDPTEQARIAKSLMAAAPFKADRERLRKDLIAMGIRSGTRKQRSR